MLAEILHETQMAMQYTFFFDIVSQIFKIQKNFIKTIKYGKAII